jgi:hypothetical protein
MHARKACNWVILTPALLVNFMSHSLYSQGITPSKLDGPGPTAGLKALEKRKIALPYQESKSGLKPISLVTTPTTHSHFPQKITNSLLTGTIYLKKCMKDLFLKQEDKCF